MRVLGISGSPRKGGNTDIIIQEALKAAEGEGADTRLIRLSDYKLEPCNACGTCQKTKNCVIDDGAEKIYQEIAKADGVILGCPSYFQGVTAQMKTFIDRIGRLCLARGRKKEGSLSLFRCLDFEGKVGGAIAVARRSGLATTYGQMLMFLIATRMIIPSGGRVFAVGREKGEVVGDKEGTDTAQYLGKMMAKTIVATESLRKKT
jgi:multimeric flavodoxin WrbA